MSAHILRPAAGRRLGVEQMQTYAISAPPSTHTRAAVCSEVGCLHHQQGWTTNVPAGHADEVAVRRAISGATDGHVRRAAVSRIGGGWLQFRFPPGQPCFRVTMHRVPLERPELYLVRGGDARADLGLLRRHTRPEFWVEDFAEHQDRTARVLNGSPQ